MQTMTVFVDFWAEKKPDTFSAAIMRFLETDYSHVAFRYVNRAGEWRVFHATTPLVCDEPLANLLNDGFIVHSFKIELPCHPEFFFGFVAGSDGKEYSPAQCAQLLMGEFRELNGNSKLICSELVGRKLAFHGVIEMHARPDAWTPPEVLAALQKKFGV